jgi:WhiB family redox-sensing transcriptional regulator
MSEDLTPACKGQDPELWFPTAALGTEARVLQSYKARGICAGCPLRVECLEVALIEGRVGIWGGTDEDERLKLRRRTLVSA